MLVLTSGPHTIALFGVGLIGSAVAQALERWSGADLRRHPLRWADADTYAHDLDAIMRALDAQLADAPRLSVIWSAGAGGFGASTAQTEAELSRFEQLVRSLGRLGDGVRADFHLMSSGGGLFEGQRAVHAHTQPRAERPYSALKLAQETLVETSGTFRRVRVYRPSSVYGRIRPGHRLGLVSTLIRNGIERRVTHLVGRTHTLRDFVHADDIGMFVAREVLSENTCERTRPYTLAAGKPSSVQEVQRAIETVLGYRTFISFDLRSGNDADTTFTPNALPGGWHPQPLSQGVRAIVEDYKSFQPDSWRRRQRSLAS